MKYEYETPLTVVENLSAMQQVLAAISVDSTKIISYTPGD